MFYKKRSFLKLLCSFCLKSLLVPFAFLTGSVGFASFVSVLEQTNIVSESVRPLSTLKPIFAVPLIQNQKISSDDFRKNSSIFKGVFDDLFEVSEDVFDLNDNLILSKGSKVLTEIDFHKRRSFYRKGLLHVRFVSITNSSDGKVYNMNLSHAFQGYHEGCIGNILDERTEGLLHSSKRLAVGVGISTSALLVAGFGGIAVASVLKNIASAVFSNTSLSIDSYVRYKPLFNVLAQVSPVVPIIGAGALIISAAIKGKKAVLAKGSSVNLIAQLREDAGSIADTN